MRFQLIRTTTFSAAHRVPTSPREASRRLHGHNFGVSLLLVGDLNQDLGWLLDFGDIRRAFAPLAEQLDHSYLNEIEGLEAPNIPSLERWVFDRLKRELPMLARVFATIEGDLDFTLRARSEDARLGLPERLAFTLESAHRLPLVGEGHKCSRLHGHSFHVEVGAGDLDRLAQSLRRVHVLLDHRYLNEIDGLENPTSENLAVWIWRTLQTDVPDLSMVAIRESAETACFYRGEE